ncbi:hypothetical protein [Chryseobacterium sp.]|uniref:hypothetical protein n=1 Tax=Chryseobacterium sp. TaxID=1871047 RepID=UPI00321BB54F
MKKAYLLLPILFLFASCLGDDSNFQPIPNDGNNNGNPNPNPNTPVLITKLVVGGETSTFSYNGSKISQIQHGNGEISKFDYSGDLIVEETLTGGSVNTTIQYDYDVKDRLLTKKENYISGTTKSTVETNYTYISSTNVKISYTRTTEGNFAGSPIITTGVRNATLNADGSLSSWSETASVPIPNSSGFYAATGALQPIEYDTKNSPYKNITGYLKIISDEDENGSVHNILNYNDVLEYNNGSGSASWSVFKSSYDYNTSNYVTRNVRNYYDKTGSNVTKTEVRNYEYNHL